MGFELIQRKQKVLNDLVQVIEQIKSLLPELSREEKAEFLEGVQSIGSIPSNKIKDLENLLPEDLSEPVPPLRPPLQRSIMDVLIQQSKGAPAKVIEQILRDHPEGIKAGEIVKLATGRIKTSSGDERSIIYSAIAYLKKLDKIFQNDKEYFLRLTSEKPY